jgi:8-oxo-dGTP pyrophosphatase MutT (NUDIX family)|tara:strand:+ start:736 stop:1164 length:429 start_codon:yes stop_codon:yes gene_type:complete
MKKHLHTNVAQYALVLRDKKLLILWPSNNTPLWVLPGGRLDEDDQDPKNALEREVEEELGMDVTINEPVCVDMWDMEGKEHRYAVFFFCELEEPDTNINLSEDHKSFEWLTYDQLKENLMTDEKRGRPGFILIDKLRDRGLL